MSVLYSKYTYIQAGAYYIQLHHVLYTIVPSVLSWVYPLMCSNHVFGALKCHYLSYKKFINQKIPRGGFKLGILSAMVSCSTS